MLKSIKNRFSAILVTSTLIAGSGLLVAPAAQAAVVPIKLSNAIGDTLVGVDESGFVLRAEVDHDEVDVADLKYLVEITTADIDYVALDWSALSEDQDGVFGDDEIADAATDAASDEGDEYFVITPNAASLTADEDTYLAITPDVGEAVSIRVTAWEDVNDDDEIGNEEQSNAISIDFIELADLAATVSVTAPVLGDDAVSVVMELAEDVNIAQYLLSEDYGDVAFLDDDTDFAAYADYEVDMEFTPAAAWGDVLADELSSTSAELDELDGNTLVFTAASDDFDAGGGDFGDTTFDVAGEGTAELDFDGSTLDADIAEFEIATKTVDNLEITTTASSTVAYDNGVVTANTVEVLEGSTSLSFTVSAFEDEDQEEAVGKNIPVQVTLSDVDLDDVVITSEGKTLKGTGVNSVSFSKNTNSSGKITFTLTFTGTATAEDESFTVAASAEGESATNQTVHFADREYSTFWYPGEAFKMPLNGTAKVGFTVLDQFLQAPTGDYQLKVTRARLSGSRATVAEQANYAYTAKLTNGTGDVTITDNGSATKEGTDTLTATLEVLSTAGSTYVAVAADALRTGAATTLNVTYETDLKTHTLTAVANNNGVKAGTTSVKAIKVEGDTLSNWAADIQGGDEPTYDEFNTYASTTAETATGLVKISGEVLTSAGVDITGAVVTISGDNMVFSDGLQGAASVYRVGSLSILSDGGDYAFYVRSAAAGVRTVTVTVGSVSKTVDLTVAGDGAVADFTVTAPTSSAPGRTVDVVIAAKDKFGNGAANTAVTLSSSGPGYLINTSGNTLADGTYTTKLLVGANEAGTAVIKVTMTIAGVQTSKTVSVAIGNPEPVAKIGSFNGRVAVRVENAKGSTISVKIGKSWYKYSALNDNYLQSWKSRKGASVAVSVYVDAELQNVQTITVK